MLQRFYIGQNYICWVAVQSSNKYPCEIKINFGEPTTLYQSRKRDVLLAARLCASYRSTSFHTVRRWRHICGVVRFASYFGQPDASSSRAIWHRTHGPQKVDRMVSLQTVPWMPSIRRTLTRMGMSPAAHIVQQHSPSLFDISAM